MTLNCVKLRSSSDTVFFHNIVIIGYFDEMILFLSKSLLLDFDIDSNIQELRFSIDTAESVSE